MMIRLSPKEMSQCQQAATLRWQLARSAGVENQRRDSGRSDNDLDQLGIKAEMAVAKAFGIDYTPFALGVDSGVDLWHGDVSIDVKSTFYETGCLLFKDLEHFKAAVSILVTAVKGSDDRMKLAGWTHRKHFAEKAQRRNLGHGDGMVMEQDKLLPIEKLWKHLTEKQYI